MKQASGTLLGRVWPGLYATTAAAICLLAALGTFRISTFVPLVFGAIWLLVGLVDLWRERRAGGSRRRLALLVAGLVLAAAAPGVQVVGRHLDNRRIERAALSALADAPALRPAYSEVLNAPTGGLADLEEGLVLLNFWATWCPPCLEEMPMLEAFAAAHRDAGVRLIGVTWTDEPPSEAEVAAVRATLEETAAGYPVLLGATPTNRERFRVEALPTTILVEDGQVIDYGIGIERTEEILEEVTERLAQEPGGLAPHR